MQQSGTCLAGTDPLGFRSSAPQEVRTDQESHTSQNEVHDWLFLRLDCPLYTLGLSCFDLTDPNPALGDQ